MTGIAIIILAIAWALLGAAVILLHRGTEGRLERLEHELRAMKRYGR